MALHWNRSKRVALARSVQSSLFVCLKFFSYHFNLNILFTSANRHEFCPSIRLNLYPKTSKCIDHLPRSDWSSDLYRSTNIGRATSRVVSFRFFLLLPTQHFSALKQNKTTNFVASLKSFFLCLSPLLTDDRKLITMTKTNSSAIACPCLID